MVIIPVTMKITVYFWVSTEMNTGRAFPRNVLQMQAIPFLSSRWLRALLKDPRVMAATWWYWDSNFPTRSTNLPSQHIFKHWTLLVSDSDILFFNEATLLDRWTQGMFIIVYGVSANPFPKAFPSMKCYTCWLFMLLTAIWSPC